MRFPPSFIDDIKTRVPVSDVVRRKVKLAKAGREWKGLSPFNSEKTPSFFVNDQKMAWFDFSSGRNGNIFDFLMATEGLSFPEAVERLALDAGLALPTVSRESEEREKRRATLHEVLEQAARFFEAQLRGAAGTKARHYLAGRGLAPPLQAQFRMGFAPAEKYALRDALAAAGADVATMIEAGLLIHGEDIAVPYDRFRDRVMFPIADRSGHIIAFGGRALDSAAPAKYLNSPETPLFHKGAVLYNHHTARKAAQAAGSVVAVEGYVDVISLAAVGVAQVVAPLGTALTADQLDLLWRMAEEPILCFDGDRAGRKAAYRAIDTAWPLLGMGKSLRFALLPDEQDPDDLARAGGPAAVTDVLDKARPLAEIVWLRETEDKDFSTPERKAALERRLTSLAQEIADETLRRYYLTDFRMRLAAFFGAPVRSAGREGAYVRQAFDPRRQQRPGLSPSDLMRRPLALSPEMARTPLFRSAVVPSAQRDALILLLLTRHPLLVDVYGEEIATLDLADKNAARLRDFLLDNAHGWEAGGDREEDLAPRLSAAGFEPIIADLGKVGGLAGKWYMQPDVPTDDAEIMLRQALTLHRRARVLHKELQLAELALANDGNERNLARLCDIQEQLTALAGMEAAIDGFGAVAGRSAGSL